MPPAKRRQTPSQTVGPFFAYGLTPAQYGYPFKSLVTPSPASDGTDGEAIRLIGQVFDGNGRTIHDAMVEIWQANAHGLYGGRTGERSDNRVDPDFTGFGRSGTGADPEARFVFETIKPGPVGEDQAPHLNLILTMRGLLNHLYTRVYFDDETAANERDPVLSAVPEPRRSTLLAKREDQRSGSVYRFDIHMQGPDETVFFDV